MSTDVKELEKRMHGAKGMRAGGKTNSDMLKMGRGLAKVANQMNPGTLTNLMCRNTISVGWDGTLFDCDFNQMLDLPLTNQIPQNIANFDVRTLKERTIVTGKHCYGCTAGSGSSCQGALSI